MKKEYSDDKNKYRIFVDELSNFYNERKHVKPFQSQTILSDQNKSVDKEACEEMHLPNVANGVINKIGAYFVNPEQIKLNEDIEDNNESSIASLTNITDDSKLTSDISTIAYNLPIDQYIENADNNKNSSINTINIQDSISSNAKDTAHKEIIENSESKLSPNFGTQNPELVQDNKSDDNDNLQNAILYNKKNQNSSSNDCENSTVNSNNPENGELQESRKLDHSAATYSYFKNRRVLLDYMKLFLSKSKANIEEIVNSLPKENQRTENQAPKKVDIKSKIHIDMDNEECLLTANIKISEDSNKNYKIIFNYLLCRISISQPKYVVVNFVGDLKNNDKLNKYYTKEGLEKISYDIKEIALYNESTNESQNQAIQEIYKIFTATGTTELILNKFCVENIQQVLLNCNSYFDRLKFLRIEETKEVDENLIKSHNLPEIQCISINECKEENKMYTRDEIERLITPRNKNKETNKGSIRSTCKFD